MKVLLTELVLVDKHQHYRLKDLKVKEEGRRKMEFYKAQQKSCVFL